MALCISCNEEPVSNKKHSLCKHCYPKFRKSENFSKSIITPRTIQQHIHKNEIEFIKNFFTHQSWLYQPTTFKFNDTHYTPDFYDQERNAFIEVVGTHQAYYDNKEKYAQVRELFPGLTFEVRTIDGNILDESRGIKTQVVLAKRATG